MRWTRERSFSSLLISMIVLVAGVVYFRRTERSFADVI